MVAPNINESIVVLVEPSLSSHGQDQYAPVRPRRVSNRTIVTRASLKGYCPDTVAILKDAFENWGSEDAVKFNERFAKKQMNHAAITVQRVVRGWLARQYTRIIHLERRLCTIRSETQNEIAQIQRDKMRRMQEIRQEVELEHRMGSCGSNSMVGKAKKIIDGLRKENQIIRKQNDELYFKILKLKLTNERLENAQERAERTLCEISRHIEHTKQSIEKHEKEKAAIADELREEIESLKAFEELALVDQSSTRRYEQTMKLVLDTLRDRMSRCNSDLKNELIEALLEHKRAFARIN